MPRKIEGKASEPTPIHIAVLVPCMDRVHSLFAFDLAQMTTFTTSVMPENCVISIHFNIGTYIHQSRTTLLQDCLNYEPRPTHLLWLDADMRFPRDAAIRLLQRQVPFVGINYSTRRMPPTFVGIKHTPFDGTPPQRLETWDHSEGLEECDALGFGCLMMDVAALANLPDPQDIPWFFFENHESGQQVGEDVWFWHYIVKKQLGQRLFCDHDLTKECSHQGDFEFKIHHPWATHEVMAELEEAEVAAPEGAEG